MTFTLKKRNQNALKKKAGGVTAASNASIKVG